MAFLTDAQLLSDLSDTLTKAAGALSIAWSNILPQAHLRAANRLTSILLGRGFTLTQIQAWDDGAVYERDLTLYFALVRGGCLNNFDAKFIEMIDVRKEVDCLTALSVGGVWQAPAGTAGQPATGALDQGNDLFGPAWSPEDPRIGKRIRW